MKVKIEIDVKPFSTPNFIILREKEGKRQDGIKEASSLPLGDVDAEILSLLCDKFRENIFIKANKKDPKEI